MGTTRTTTVTTTTTPTITFTEDELNPYVAPVPTRHRLTGTGLSGRQPDGALPKFTALRTHGPRTTTDSTAGSEGRLADLLDAVRGEIPTTYFPHGGPGPMPARPLAPALDKLVRCATAVDELAALRGQFASYAGRLGPRAVAEASRRLLSVFEAGEESAGEGAGAAGLFRKLAAVIRPLSLAAGPGTASGLALDLPVRLLDEEFGSGEVVRFEHVDLPGTLTHAPTRRFLRERGLPERAAPFSLDADMPLQTLAEHCADGLIDAPAGADRLIRLGGLPHGTGLVLDGTTGAVLTWSAPDLAPRPLNADISTLAFTLWLVGREHALDAVLTLTEACDRLAETMCRTLATTDPTPCDRDAG